MELEYTKKLIAKVIKTGTNKQKYQVVKELRRKYALKDLLEIASFPKSVYYYYEHHKSTDKYKYWNKKVYEQPEVLNFWFDFLDVEGELS